MAYATPVAHNKLCSVILNTIQETTTSVNHFWSRDHNNMWEMWQQFYTALGLFKLLHDIENPVPFLQVLFRRCRYGQISHSGEPVRYSTVEEAIRAMGSTSIFLGAKNSRLNSFGNFNECISYQLSHRWKSIQRLPAWSRIWSPYSITLIMWTLTLARNHNFT